MGGSVVYIRRGDLPINHLTSLIEHEAELASYDPAAVALAHSASPRGPYGNLLRTFLADLYLAAPLADRVQQLDAIGVRDAHHRRVRQEAIGPVPMSREAPEEARTLRQVWEQRQAVALDPPVERAAVSRKRRGNARSRRPGCPRP